MQRPKTVWYIRHWLGEFNPVILQPADSGGGFVDKSPDQIRIGPPVAVVHHGLECLFAGVIHIHRALHFAPHGEHPLSETGAPSHVAHLFEKDDPSAPFSRGQGGSQPGSPAANHDDIVVSFFYTFWIHFSLLYSRVFCPTGQ